MFPYPSGDGLHVGHPKGYIATDVYARHKRMLGYDVLHPMGWDAFGLPAENYALKNEVHPSIAVKKNIKRFKSQLQRIGFTYDWEREINTTDPRYYKWTQWIFLQMYKAGLAFQSREPIHWCQSCKTGLANEDVEDGKCERCGSVVLQKAIPQWVLRITKYADRLLSGLETLDWPEYIKESQRNWIGRSEGAEIEFGITNNELRIKVFTTRPDTLFGATYLVLAPEHPALKNIESRILNIEEVKKYQNEAKSKTEIERTAEGREKTGVELKGIKATNPASKEEIPVWIADYVLADYGTGAIMAVPAHDERDFQFASRFELPIKSVNNGRGIHVFGDTKEQARIIELTDDAYIKKGLVGSYSATKGEKFWTHAFIFKDSSIEAEFLKLIARMEFKFSAGPFIAKVPDLKAENSGMFNGLSTKEAQAKITEFVGGKLVVKYKLRDWIFSRQRYWGEPIPLIHCGVCGVVPVPEKDLPVRLPNVKSYAPAGTGESPLAKIETWVNVRCPKCKGRAKRETNTMPSWAGSCWYHLAYIVKRKTHGVGRLDSSDAIRYTLYDKRALERWLPVDMYVGGAEHATRHLIYARFWHKFLYDLGVLRTDEPFQRLQNVGLILAADGRKMSKRFGNVVNPDEIVERFGADSLRIYEMFMGPFNQPIAWNTDSLVGARRFLERVWKLRERTQSAEHEDRTKHKTKNTRLESLLHQTIKKVGDDIEAFRFNTAVSALMILLNALEKEELTSSDAYKTVLKLLAPFAPHITEELWARLGFTKSIHLEQWPVYDERIAASAPVTIIVQVNGKTRGSIITRRGEERELLETTALSLPLVQKWLESKTVERIIVVPDKLVNIVIRE